MLLLLQFSLCSIDVGAPLAMASGYDSLVADRMDILSIYSVLEVNSR